MFGKKMLCVCAFVLVACTSTPQSSPKSEVQPAPEPAAAEVTKQAEATNQPEVAQAGLTRIQDPSTVCMINDQHMGVAQIPVQVEGKTYYGCCQMCEAKLKTTPQARLGTDPVSQKPVDKATAVLAKDASGRVLYFESDANLQAYAARL